MPHRTCCTCMRCARSSIRCWRARGALSLPRPVTGSCRRAPSSICRAGRPRISLRIRNDRMPLSGFLVFLPPPFTSPKARCDRDESFSRFRLLLSMISAQTLCGCHRETASHFSGSCSGAKHRGQIATDYGRSGAAFVVIDGEGREVCILPLASLARGRGRCRQSSIHSSADVDVLPDIVCTAAGAAIEGSSQFVHAQEQGQKQNVEANKIADGRRDVHGAFDADGHFGRVGLRRGRRLLYGPGRAGRLRGAARSSGWRTGQGRRRRRRCRCTGCWHPRGHSHEPRWSCQPCRHPLAR